MKASENLTLIPTEMAALATLGLLGAFGCSEPPAGRVALQIASRPSPQESRSPSFSRVAAGDSAIVAVGGDTIVIRRADLVLRHIWLQPAESGECEPEEEEYCAELRNEPVVISFPLADTAKSGFTSPAKAGAYSGLQVDLYTPAAEHDSAFVAAHPDLADASVRIEGRFMKAGSWREFVATSDLTGIQELALEPPLDVRAGDTAWITLRLDLARVFLNPEGTALVDPTSGVAGQSNAHLVNDNIRMSLHSFRDENQDGLEDDRGPQALVPDRTATGNREEGRD